MYSAKQTFEKRGELLVIERDDENEEKWKGRWRREEGGKRVFVQRIERRKIAQELVKRDWRRKGRKEATNRELMKMWLVLVLETRFRIVRSSFEWLNVTATITLVGISAADDATFFIGATSAKCWRNCAVSDAERSLVARLLMQSTRRGWRNRKAESDKELIVCNCVRNYFYGDIPDRFPRRTSRPRNISRSTSCY